MTFQNCYWAKTVLSTNTENQGAVINPTGLLGPRNEGLFTQLCTLHPDDSVEIILSVGNLAGQESANGQIYIYGYSEKGYTSELLISTSTDGVSWRVQLVQ
jgi:hypothetical protein